MSVLFCRVFYAGMVYAEYDSNQALIKARPELPDGVFLHLPHASGRPWFLKDLTPVLLSDVPPELQLLNLLLT